MKPTTSTPPTELGLARIKFEDELDTAIDHMNGAATLLTAMLPTQAAGERDALNLLADALYETADGLQAAFDAVTTLQRAEALAAEDTTAKEADAPKDAHFIADTAHIDALTAQTALQRLTSMIVSGELDPHEEADMDAFVCLANGIGARVAEVADALDKLLDRLGAGDKKEG